MAIYRPSEEGDPENTPKPTFHSRHEEDQYYYNMKDPRTGHRYDIPMLDRLSSMYRFDYIEYMKIKDESEEIFNKVLNWD